MARPKLTAEERRIRQLIYRFVVREDRCPTLNEIAKEARLVPLEAQRMLERLETEHEAIVLSPGSGNIWLADPFAALPTPYPVHAEPHHWFGMCVWDALGILAIARCDGRAPTLCPVSGTPLELRVENGALVRGDGIVHFAVPAADWWRDIGFT